MKRCPTCDRTFEDSMRFCQSDGTPLVDDAPVDPYKTMVARPQDIASAMPPSDPSAKDDEQVLQIPEESDPNKTMYASEGEIRREMDKHDEQVIEIPPLSSDAPPEPPKFNEPSLTPRSFGGSTPPPSPFGTPQDPMGSEHEDPFTKTTPPIPSPFGEKKPSFEPPSSPIRPQYAEPEPPLANEPAFNPFDAPEGGQQMSQPEWNPPPAPNAGWQNQEIGQNTPFQPPPAGTGGVNQTLPIISLVLGIVSICCYISPVTGIAALITGFKGMKNANNDPQNFGGKGLAIAGMVLGGIFFLLGVLYWIYIIFVIGFAALGSMGNF